MKCLSAGGLLTLLIFLSFFVEGVAQSSAQPLEQGYYIVVAAYRLHQDTYAQNYINRINKNGVDAKYGADLSRKYLYVYLDYYTDFSASVKEMLATRQRAGFEKAWVRIMKDGPNTNINLLTQNEPIAESKPTTAIPDEEKTKKNVTPPTQPKEEEKITKEAVEEKIEPKVVKAESVKALDTTKEDPITEAKPIAEATVFLSLFNATNNKQIEGEVEVVDSERARLISKVKGNEFIKIPDPKSKTGKINLLANVFGYRPIQHDLYFGQVAHDSVSHFMEWAGNHYVIKFDLVRYHRGDINTLYNVYFYNDAAIMLPESKYQLNSLLTMMNENSNYRIKLHGHTNGNSRGRLITMGPSKSFFALADDVKDGTGSAKELSKHRAEVIKAWLVSQGVAENRVEIKAWGGGRMLHDKNSVNAKRNVRVDVEILEE